jgi:hypothetical protein
MKSVCHGYRCASTDLIRAHLTPQSFARFVQGNSSPNLMVSLNRYTTKLSRGLFDPNILCERCDSILNSRYDDPAFELLRALDLRLADIVVPARKDAFFEHQNTVCDLLCRFILSILWRYSISRLPDAAHINLGPYQEGARDVLWGVRSMAEFPQFQVICQRYAQGPVDARKMYSSPVDMKGEDFFSYGFSMIGFHFIAKMDKRPFPQIYEPWVLTGDILRGYYVDFHDTPQGRGAREMLVDWRRRGGRRRR